MHVSFLCNLLLALPLSAQGPEPKDVPQDPPPQEAPEPEEMPEKKPMLQDRPAVREKAAEEIVKARTVLQLAPRGGSGLWLDEKGEPGVRITALALLALAMEGNTFRAGSGRQEVRLGGKALVDLLKERKQGVGCDPAMIDNDVLLALSLFSHARMARYRILYSCVGRSLAKVFHRERLKVIFSDEDIGSRIQDGTRLIYFLLHKQIRLSRTAPPGVVRPSSRISDLDPKLMQAWLDRGLKDTNADPERLLILFLGHLVVNPPKEPPLAAGITGFLWKRAQRIIKADQKKSGKELSPRLLFLDTFLRTQFLNRPYAKELREGRKKRLEAWEKQIRKLMGQKLDRPEGLSEDDLYRLMSLAMLRGSSTLWK